MWSSKHLQAVNGPDLAENLHAPALQQSHPLPTWFLNAVDRLLHSNPYLVVIQCNAGIAVQLC